MATNAEQRSLDTDRYRKMILEEQARLRSLKEGLADELDVDETEQESVGELSSMDQHQADLGSETFEREKDFAVLESIESQLGDIDLALAKLDGGTYGTCEDCGKPIPEERLEALPIARYCVEDQAKREDQA